MLCDLHVHRLFLTVLNEVDHLMARCPQALPVLVAPQASPWDRQRPRPRRRSTTCRSAGVRGLHELPQFVPRVRLVPPLKVGHREDPLRAGRLPRSLEPDRPLLAEHHAGVDVAARYRVRVEAGLARRRGRVHDRHAAAHDELGRRSELLQHHLRLAQACLDHFDELSDLASRHDAVPSHSAKAQDAAAIGHRGRVRGDPVPERMQRALESGRRPLQEADLHRERSCEVPASGAPLLLPILPILRLRRRWRRRWHERGLVSEELVQQSEQWRELLETHRRDGARDRARNGVAAGRGAAGGRRGLARDTSCSQASHDCDRNR
mmetsp:Transcript_35627/g.61572  ORF Transcript_35627/g.61572 Transcript_35627/m.61572 type:complete len:321 (-) Transcript_35627:108-1070(-)